MPFYQFTSPAGLLDQSGRERIAEQITQMHCAATGAPRIFVHVSFAEYKTGTYFHGGKPSNVAFIRIGWRAGRSLETRQAFMKSTAEMWAREAKTDVKDIVLSLAEMPSENAMEFGHILPYPGKEQEWLEQHGFAGQAT